MGLTPLMQLVTKAIACDPFVIRAIRGSDVGCVLNGGRDAEADAGMLHNVTQSVAVLDGIALRERRILPFQKRLIAARPSLRRLRSQRAARFALADLSSNSAGFVRLVTVLR